MRLIKDSKLLNRICKDYNINLTSLFETTLLYSEIEEFKDYEYIYCIAYEMLIRTDEYNFLVNEYWKLIEANNKVSKSDKAARLDELITNMDQLGLNRNSFLGFDCGNGNVFEKIKLYDEITGSPWSVRTLDKFVLDSNSKFENILDCLIAYYYDNKKLYIVEDIQADVKTYLKTDIHPRSTFNIDDQIFIPCYNKTTKETVYKSLTDTIYLKELDDDFLSTLVERKKKNVLRQITLNYSVSNSFWHKYSLSDVKYGIDKLITFYINNKKIRKQKAKEFTRVNSLEVFYNLSKFFIPCIDHSGEEQKEVMLCLNKNMPLNVLADEFLSTLEYADLKGNYIETEPVFSRPKLMFDEARLINLPVNLNLSKEELLLYISEIKEDYDKNKDIVKDSIEYIFDLTLESDNTEVPENIKYIGEDVKKKQLLPTERKKFKKALSKAFYIYDVYKVFLPYFEDKQVDIINNGRLDISNIEEGYKYDRNSKSDKIDYSTELKKTIKANLKRYDIISEIRYLFDDLSEEQVKYYLNIMKEFIHGVNLKNENNKLKKDYNHERFERPTPKYKDIIIGDSYILKSNKGDIVKNLFGNLY